MLPHSVCEVFVYFPAQLQNTKDMTNLRRINSALSEDCERYISEINELSEEREKLNEKVMQCEECIEVSLQLETDLGGSP